MAIDYTVFKGSKGGQIVKAAVQSLDLRHDEVLVRVTHSGLCGSDIHHVSEDMALGHEGAGMVQDVGASVTTLKEGDRVGWGFIQSCCGHCQQCLTGKDAYCSSRRMYGVHDRDQGSLGTHVIRRAEYLTPIPTKMASEDAAPLMCAGATVFNVLMTYGVKATDRVGVVGFGGLGHLAVLFAAKLGCEVTVCSRTGQKAEDALEVGANQFYTLDRLEDPQSKVKKMDHLLVTTNTQPDWSLYLPHLSPGATIYPLYVDSSDLQIPHMPLLANGIRIQGSIVASRQTMKDMLAFAAHRLIRPRSMAFPMDEEGITEAFKLLRNDELRYKAVFYQNS
ncbi:MAG: hypothetical protein M1817_002313 [Caeruleum heppii]|nr:MAG: hypothetical protein M1817_003502 [Caeruleum heppii]KAI9673675.1 MAG: hypothetical protein M1817_002313 [Caeruleum heppii]